MATYKTPGVYVEEISKLPPSVAEVATAIPAFIGYTQNNSYNGVSLVNKPKRIKSLNDYEHIFGLPANTVYNSTGTAATIGIKIISSGGELKIDSDLQDPYSNLQFKMYYCLQLYFANGGGPCYVVSCGKYSDAVLADNAQMKAALDAVRKEDEPTILLFTDSTSLTEDLHYDLCKSALTQAADLMDRVALLDVYLLTADILNPANAGNILFENVESTFRSKIGNNNLSYGAAYYPWLKTTLNYYLDESLQVISSADPSLVAVTTLRKYPPPGSTEVLPADQAVSLYHLNNQLYEKVKKEMEKYTVILPPSHAMAGIYAMVDNTRGVWKSPANVSLNFVKELLVRLDELDQQDMNVTATGKSVNAIRNFSGKGILVWGARTLAGNDNEWRYISVRRFYNMVEESVKKASEPFVFEPNDANTWTKVRAMIENYLILKWRDGALMGSKPEEAFFVHVGLRETMTALDILEGRMIIEIGLAVVRPAEFIILRFSHKMAVS